MKKSLALKITAVFLFLSAILAIWNAVGLFSSGAHLKGFLQPVCPKSYTIIFSSNAQSNNSEIEVENKACPRLVAIIDRMIETDIKTMNFLLLYALLAFMVFGYLIYSIKKIKKE